MNRPGALGVIRDACQVRGITAYRLHKMAGITEDAAGRILLHSPESVRYEILDRVLAALSLRITDDDGPADQVHA